MGKKLGVEIEVRKGAWTKEEDFLLTKCIQQYGEGKWNLVPLRAGLNRCRKSCRMRYLNYLRPNLKKGSFSEGEIDLIVRMHKLLGNRWSLIAGTGRLPGRTGNDIKNFWNFHICKKVPSTSTNCRHDHDHEIVVTAAAAANTHIIKPTPHTISKHFASSSSSSSSSSSASLFNREANDDDDDGDHKHKQNPLMDEEKEERIRWWKNMLQMSRTGDDHHLPFSSFIDEENPNAAVPPPISSPGEGGDYVINDLDMDGLFLD